MTSYTLVGSIVSGSGFVPLLALSFLPRFNVDNDAVSDNLDLVDDICTSSIF